MMSELIIEIRSRLDSDYSKCTSTGRNISEHNAKVEGSVVIYISSIQNTTTLLVTESEIVSGMNCAQDMLFTNNVVNSIGMKAKLPILLEISNNGSLDMAHIDSVALRTENVKIKELWLSELQEKRVLDIIWVS